MPSFLSLLASSDFLAISHIWHSLASAVSPPLSASIFPWHSPCVCKSLLANFSLFIRAQSYWNRAHPNDFILTWSSARMVFPNKVRFTIARCRISTLLEGNKIQHDSMWIKIKQRRWGRYLAQQFRSLLGCLAYQNPWVLMSSASNPPSC